MAGRRVAITAIDWAKIAERVPDGQKQKFLAFRAKSDSYLRRLVFFLINYYIPNSVSYFQFFVG